MRASHDLSRVGVRFDEPNLVPSAGLLRQSSTPAAISAIVSTAATTTSPRRSRSGRTRLGRRSTDCGGQDSLVVRGAPDSRERTC